MVVFLTFFTNFVLLATFLGMSVGCLAASNRRNLVETVIPLLLLSVTLACAVLFIYLKFGKVMIDVGGQGSPQQIYFGTEYRARDVYRFVVPIEAVAATFFLLISLMFIGLGQVMGRLFNSAANRVTAYTMNIAGSLIGIGAFALASYLQMPPELWFAIALGLTLFFVTRLTHLQIYAQIAVLLIIAWSGRGVRSQMIWSPYYKINYRAQDRFITTNNIGHQKMISVGAAGLSGRGYLLPHLLNRDSGGAPFKDVLVIGAGSGNDVAAALKQGAVHVDAVEIDPAIYNLGLRDHPDQPYKNPRVSIHIDDGRSYLRRTDRQYDLIVYALVDSLVLHSGYSNIRLESFLFTKEAFEDIKARLKPGGIFAAYNSFRQGWVVGRLTKMMRGAFGCEPLVMSLPYTECITPNAPFNRCTFILDGSNSATLERIRQRLSESPYQINNAPELNDHINGFDHIPTSVAGGAASGWNRISLTKVEERKTEAVPTDDWPFLYLREAVVPALNLRGIAIIAILSAALIFAFSPARRAMPNWRMFFIGAGFMLIETKSVVHMALLFGSTWMVNSIVFAAILVMILCSNLFVLIFKPRRLWPQYALLAAALLVGFLVPMHTFLNLPGAQHILVPCAVVFVPIFFAGIVFAMAFRDSREPDADFGSNIAGAILGGVCESLSLMIGFNNLLVVALLFYGLSAVLNRRAPALSPAVPRT